MAPRPPDLELVQFRVDADLRAAAEACCARLGIDLGDALRALVVRLAKDGALPFELQAAPANVPGINLSYDGPAWADLVSGIDAELALALLSRAVRDRTAALEAARRDKPEDATVVARLEAERAQAMHLLKTLDIADASAVRRTIALFARPSGANDA